MNKNEESIPLLGEIKKKEVEDIRKSSVRWLMLIMACFYIFGINFCYDGPGPL